tara:strand:- start:890 stop:6592 length:5703 start_codon:yes stop_codon:yes gene_type:complete
MSYNAEKDVIPFVGADDEVDVVLFITDGKGEPKKINVRRCIEGDTAFTGNATLYGAGSQEMNDFLKVCSRTPMKPIEFSFDTESDQNGNPIQSSFVGTDGMQFCYQLVYNDGFVSSISPFSEVAYPTAVKAMGVNALSTLQMDNVCNLELPSDLDKGGTSLEVRRVKLFFREGNEGVLKFIDEVSLTTNQSEENWDLGNRVYSFRNNEVYGVVSNEVLNKNFDYVPKKANSQTVSDDRLMYGGYTEGFDRVVTSSFTTVLFEDRITRLIGSEIEAKMNITLGDGARGAYDSAEVTNTYTNSQKKQMHGGFRLDLRGMELGEEGVYDIRINIRPKQNFHIFSAQNMYGQAFAYFNGENGTKLPSGIIDADNRATAGYSGMNNSPKSDDITSDTNVSETVLGTAGNPSNRALTWDGQTIVQTGPEIGGASFAAGTGPTNPIILKGGLLSFRVAFRTSVDMSPNLFAILLNDIIMNGEYTGVVSGLPSDAVQVFESPGTVGSAPEFEHIVDLGLENEDSFDPDDELADLICHVTNSNGDATNPTGIGAQANKLGGFANYPLAYYIINRAKAIFSLGAAVKEDDGGIIPAGQNALFNDGTQIADQALILTYKFKLKDLKFPQASEFLGQPFQGEVPQVDGSYYQAGSRFGNVLTCIPTPIEGFGAQTLSIQSNDGLVVGMAFQGGHTYDDGDSTMGDRWRKGEVDLDGLADSGVNYPGTDQNFIDDPNNYFYDSLPLMPFACGRTEPDSLGRGFEFRWPIAKTVTGTNVPNSNIAHPSPDGLGVKTDNGEFIDFKTYDESNNPNAAINLYGRVQGGDGPIAIGKWTVFDGPGLNKWFETFSYDAEFRLKRTTDHNNAFGGIMTSNEDGGADFSGVYTFRPSHPVTWLPFPWSWDNQGQTGSAYSHSIRGYGALWLTKFNNFEIEDHKDPDGSYTFSVVDGASGPGGGATQSFSDSVISAYAPGDQFGAEATGPAKPVSNTKGSVTNKTLIGICDNMPFISPERTYMLTDDDDFPEGNESVGAFDDIGNLVSVVTASTSVEGSFKTNDIHNFGIVYYDERGRCSSVYRLPSVFVPGYSPTERANGQKGSASVQFQLVHAMPSWAETYQIVYGGPSNTRRFRQFFAGGAFTEKSAVGSQDDKIYVSLNYLQGNGISYTKAFGAKDQDTGEPILYRYSEGDKVRLISSFINEDSVEYHPSNYVFDVIGVEEISEFEDNPLLSDDEDYSEVLRRTGSFLVLRNNLQVTGFDAQKVAQGTDRWGDRTLIEIVTPKKDQDEQRIPYFETGIIGLKSAPAGSEGPHNPDTVVVDQGDVFFRAVPNNARAFENGEFVDLIKSKDDKDEDDSSSRFRGFYMESDCMSDLFRSKAKNYGRVHYAKEEPAETYNEASIIYGEKNVAESFRPKLTSFPSPANFLDLPKKYGAIDYLYDTGASITALQETKVSEIQVNKAITTVAGASGENLALSRNVLNDPRFYKPDLGSSKRPDSVLVVDNDIYFIDSAKKVLGRIDSQGIEVISSGKTSKLFQDFFIEKYAFIGEGPEMKVKYSLGHNPRTKEIILTRYLDTNTLGGGIWPNIQLGLIQDDPEGIYFYPYEEGDVFYGLNEANPTFVASSSDLFLNGSNTIAYSMKGGYWKTFYSFGSKRYADVDNTFISIYPSASEGIESPEMIWRHNEDGVRNSFYGNTYASYFKSVVNDNPTTSHIYTNISIDGTSPWNVVLTTENELTPVTSFVNKEDTFYSEIPRTEIQGGTSHMKTIGIVSDVEDVSTSDRFRFRVTFENPIDYTFNVGSATDLFFSPEGSLVPVSELGFGPGLSPSGLSRLSLVEVNRDSAVFESNQISSVGYASSNFADLYDSLVNKPVFIRSIPRFFGDPLRGKYLKVEAIKAPSEDELVSINISGTPSNLDSSM